LPAPPDGDRQLCSLAAAGDRRAFRELVARHEGRLRAFLTRLAGADLADDLAQEAFLKAWRHLALFRGEARFGSWLCGIGWRCYADHLRRARADNRKHNALAELPDDTHPFAGDTEIDVDRALGTLAPVERAALILCDGHGWSHVEAAEMLGMPLGTLKRAVARAKAKCRALLMEKAG
jgi:RNA polymerase sigma factor (sigma-70 family)